MIQPEFDPHIHMVGDLQVEGPCRDDPALRRIIDEILLDACRPHPRNESFAEVSYRVRHEMKKTSTLPHKSA